MISLRALLFALVFLGCSGESGNTPPPNSPQPILCIPVQPVGSVSGAASATTVIAPGWAVAPMATAAPIVQYVPVVVAQTPPSTSPPVAIAPPVPASPASVVPPPTAPVPPASPSAVTAPVPSAKLGTLRGSVTTLPAQSAQHAVVYIENASVKKVVDAKLDDHQMNFSPYVSVMTVGGTLTYVNGEPFADSAYSTSHESWDFGMVESHGIRKRKFEKPGTYNILCHLHPNQLAFLVVTPSSYFARTNKGGEFTIVDIPPGSYEVVAWAPRVKSERRMVVVGDGETTADFSLKR